MSSINSELVGPISDTYNWLDVRKAVDDTNRRYGRDKVRVFGEGENAIFYSNGKFHVGRSEFPALTSGAAYAFRRATGKFSFDPRAASDILFAALEMYVDPD